MKKIAARARLVGGLLLTLAALTALGLTVRAIYFNGELRVAGIARPSNQINLNFQNARAGYVSEVRVKIGDRVKAGDILATGDDRVSKVTIDAAKATLAADKARLALLHSPLTAEQLKQLDLSISQATKAVSSAQVAFNDASAGLTAQQSLQGRLPLDQYHNLAQAQLAKDAAQRELINAEAQLALVQNEKAVKTSPTTSADLQAAEATIAKDEADLAVNQRQRDDIVLAAPADGVITSINATVGDLVDTNGVRNFQGPAPLQQSLPSFQFLQPQPAAPSSGSQQQFIPVLTMAGSGAWKVIAQVRELDITKLRPGDRLAVSFNALPGVSDSAHMIRVVPVAVQTPSGVYYNVEFSLDTVPDQLLPGMTANLATQRS